MKTTKQTLALFLAISLLFTFVACKQKTDDKPAPTPPSKYVVTFHKNIPLDDETTTQTFTEGEALALLKNNFTRDGYAFAGWALTEDGDREYSDEQIIKVSANLDLYAKWGLEITVSFDGNFGSLGSGTGTMENVTFIEGVPYSLPQNAYTNNDDSKIFSGWDVVKSDTAKFGDSAEVTLTIDGNTNYVLVNGNVTGKGPKDVIPLYAIWVAKKSVFFYPNNGSTDPYVVQDFIPGREITLLPNKFTYDGMQFMGWADWVGTGSEEYGKLATDNGQVGQTGGRVYDDEQHVTFDDSVSLYAVWRGYKTISKGTYTVGGDANSSSRTIHDIEITYDYQIATNEVTQEEWKSVMTYDIYNMGGGSDDYEGDLLPMGCVSWYQAIVYCNKLSISEGLDPCYEIVGWDNAKWMSLKAIELPNAPEKGAILLDDNDEWRSVTCDFTKNGYRLPTEAEWEVAARGTNEQSHRFHWAGFSQREDENNSNLMYSSTKDFLAKYAHTNGKTRTSEIMKYRSNSNGLYDMTGNVWEWCWDWYETWDPEFYTAPTETVVDPKGPDYVAETINKRVRRGGGYSAGWDGNSPQITYRGQSQYPVRRSSEFGFRLCRTIVPETP